MFTCVEIVGDLFGILLSVLVFILYLPCMPCICAGAVLYPERGDPEERAGFITRDRAERENEDQMDAILRRINKVELRL